MLNNASLVGRLVKPVEKSEGKDTIRARFSIAFKSGKEETSFINCTAFGGTAKVMSEYVKKGDLVGVNGYLRQNKFTNKEGKTISDIELIVSEVELLTAKPQEPKAEDLPPIEEEEIPAGWHKDENGHLVKDKK